MKTKILITGGAGYVGSVLTPFLLENGFEITVVDNFLHKQNSLLECCLNRSFEVVRGDCRDRELIKSLLKDKDVVIPLAAIVGAPMCHKDRLAAETTNVGAIKLLIELTSPSQRIFYPTTNSGYGIGEKDKYCSEETPLRPISFYGMTKAQAEKMILDRGGSITFRLATAFGASARMRRDLLVNDFVYRAVTDRAVLIFEGHFKRNYIHVRDIAKAFLHAIRNFEAMQNKAYNVGLEDANLSKIELCRIIQKQIPNFVFIEAPVGEDPDKRDYIVSNKRILSAGYKPDWTLEDGIRELVKCYTIVRESQYSNA